MFLDIEQLAALLAVSVGSIRRRIADDRTFPQPVRVGKLMRWRRAAIAEWAERSERGSRRKVKSS
jgi:predicted DNA-binding transcriptional regulator AlpA